MNGIASFIQETTGGVAETIAQVGQGVVTPWNPVSLADPLLSIGDEWDRTISLIRSQTNPRVPDQMYIGEVWFRIVKTESLTESLEPQSHPVESRKQVTDHAWRQPMEVAMQGLLVGYPKGSTEHKDALQKLQEYKEKAQPVTLTTDFAPGHIPNMLITRFSAERRYPYPLAYNLSIEMREIQFVEGMGEGSPTAAQHLAALPDLGLPGFGIDTSTTDLGLLGETSWSFPVPGSEGLGAFLDSVGGLMDQLEEGEKRRFSSQVESSLEGLPGLAEFQAAKNGDLSAKQSLLSGAELLPGGSDFINTLLSLDSAPAMPGAEAQSPLSPMSPPPTSPAETAAANVIGAALENVGAIASDLSAPGTLFSAALKGKK